MNIRFAQQEVEAAVGKLQSADIVIGIPSYNNAKTIGHVVRAAHAGILKYFPQFTGVIVNSDGGSSDGTPQAVLESKVEDSHILLLNTPLKPVNRLTFPYHGIPGKGSAFRLVFQLAAALNAKACAVVDADLRSITPEWFDLLIRPVLLHGYDFVTPYYHRHKYDGTITNSIIYPLTRTLYGKRIRQPIGGDFGMSSGLVRRYLARNDWETEVARFGIDIWMTTIAVAEGFRVCQSFLGAKLHDAKDPGSDLSAMFVQVLGSLFSLMEEYEPVWRRTKVSEPIDLFGFRYDVGLDPIPVNLERMLRNFRQGAQELGEIWEQALQPDTLRGIQALVAAAKSAEAQSTFHLSDELWVRIVYDFAVAFHHKPIERGHLLRSFTPLYIGRVGSFVIETKDMFADDFEERMEALCRTFERNRDYLKAAWSRHTIPDPASAPKHAPTSKEISQEVQP